MNTSKSFSAFLLGSAWFTSQIESKGGKQMEIWNGSLEEGLSKDGAGGLSCEEACHLIPRHFANDLDEDAKAKVEAHMESCFECFCKRLSVETKVNYEGKVFFSEEEMAEAERMMAICEEKLADMEEENQ